MHEYKGYKMEHDGGIGLVYIKSKGKGSVPRALDGAYTSYEMAKQAIDAHGKREKKEENSSGEEQLNG